MRIRMQTPMQIGIQFRIQGIVEQILKKRSVGKKCSYFCASVLPSWIQIRILNLDPSTMRIRMRIQMQIRIQMRIWMQIRPQPWYRVPKIFMPVRLSPGQNGAAWQTPSLLGTLTVKNQ